MRDSAMAVAGLMVLAIAGGCGNFEEAPVAVPAPQPPTAIEPAPSAAPVPPPPGGVTFVPPEAAAPWDPDLDLPPIPTPPGIIVIGGDRVRAEGAAEEAVFTPPPAAAGVPAPPPVDGGVEWADWSGEVPELLEEEIPRVDGGIDGFEEEWETVEVVEVEWRDPITVPCDPWAGGAPVIVVEGWVARSRGSFPAVVSAPGYDPCLHDRTGRWVETAYDPAWDPRCDPRYGSWATYHHEREDRHGDVFHRNDRVQVLGDGSVVVVGRGGSGHSHGTGTGGGFPAAPGTGGSGRDPVSGGGSGGGGVHGTRPEGTGGFARAVPTDRRAGISRGPALPSESEPRTPSTRGESRWGRSRPAGEESVPDRGPRERPVRFDDDARVSTGSPSRHGSPAADESSPGGNPARRTRTVAGEVPRTTPRTEIPAFPRRERSPDPSGPAVEEPRARRAAPMPDRAPDRAERPVRGEAPRADAPRRDSPSPPARESAVPFTRELPRRGAEAPAPRTPDPAPSPPPAARGRGAAPDDEAPPPRPRRGNRRK